MGESRKGSRGWGASIVGFVLTIAGFGVIIYVMFTSTSVAIPLNTTTFAGIGVAGVGIALAAIGFERDRPNYG